MNAIQVTVTTATEENARQLARAAIARRLAASVHIVGPISSHYWWNDRQHTATEWQCIAKSHRYLYPALERLWLDLHPYEIPELFATDIPLAHADYLQWLEQQLVPPEEEEAPQTTPTDSVK